MRYDTEKENYFFNKRKNIALSHVQSLLALASEAWWFDNGHTTVIAIAEKFDVNIHKLTLLIQHQMSVISGVDLPNTAPDVDEPDKRNLVIHPRNSYGEIPYTLELFYFVKNGMP